MTLCILEIGLLQEGRALERHSVWWYIQGYDIAGNKIPSQEYQTRGANTDARGIAIFYIGSGALYIITNEFRKVLFYDVETEPGEVKRLIYDLTNDRPVSP